MDNALNSVDRLAPYTGSGKVAPSHHSEKDKERKNSDTLEQSFEDELEQEQKEHRHDTVTLHKDAHDDDADPDNAGFEQPDQPTRANASEDDPGLDSGHVDLRA